MKKPAKPAPTPIAVVCADTHLQACAWSTKPTLAGDAEHSLRQIVDAAVRLGLPVIGAGDLLDGQRNYARPVVVWYQELARLAEAGLAFYYIDGNHDESVPSWLSAAPAAVNLDLAWVELGGVRVQGLSYRSRADLPAGLSAVGPETDVLVAHQAWSELLPTGTTQGNLADVPHVKLVVTGDLHKAVQTEVVAADGRTIRVYSPGSTCMQDVAEPPHKSFGVLHDDLSIKIVALNTRPFLDVVVKTVDEVFARAKGLPTEVDTARRIAEGLGVPPGVAVPIVRVSYHPEAAEAALVLGSAVEGVAHVFWTPLGRAGGGDVGVSDGGVGGEVGDLVRVAVGDGIARQVPEARRDDCLDLSDRLLSASEPKAALREWFANRRKAGV